MNAPARTSSWMHRQARARGLTWGDDPEAFDPDFVAAQVERLATLFGPGGWCEAQADGWEHLPEGGALLVGNHSGGTLAMDGFGFSYAWYAHHGPEVPLHGLMHEIVFSTERLGSYFARGGMVRASREVTQRLLVDAQRYVLVMPGGDRDVWRPSRRRDEACFAGRTGYAELALRLGVPIVPVAHVGAHDTFWVLTDGHRFASRLGIIRKIARAEIFPVALSLPWGLQVGPWPHLPPPTLFQYRLGAPIHPTGEVSPEAVAALDAEVRAAIEGLIGSLRAARPRRRDWLRGWARRAMRGATSAGRRG